MKRQPPGTRNRRDAQQSLPNKTFRDNDDIKVHETSLSTMYRRFSQIVISKDVIKAMAIALAVAFAFLAGANSVSCTHIERGRPSQFPESALKDAFPRYVRHLINETEQGMDVRRLDLNMDLYPSKRTIYASKEALQQQEHLHDSKDYKYSRPDVFETAECKAQYPWQLMQFPTCNTVFENDLTAIYTEKHKRMRPSLIAHGYWRDVWLVKDFNTSKRVMKTLRYEHAFEGRNYDRHLRDALTMERMTKSSHVVDIYGFCGNSGLFEYGRGGDIMDRLWPEQKENNLTMLDKLEIATQVAMAVADLHNFDKEGQASVAHTDISPSQFISINGVFKLNDFNRVRFLRWSMELNEPCGYYVGKNPGKLRSPEEYSYDEQSEKVDIYAMGNIFHMLLTEKWPFEDVDENDVKQLVIKGKRPDIPEDIWNSNDTISKTLKEAMILCHEQNSTERASARQVEKLLKEKLLELHPHALVEWGLDSSNNDISLMN